MGRIKARMGLRGKTKPGEMISRMNSMKGKPTKKKGALRKTGKFEGKSNRLGGGGRFKQLVAKGKSPALAAYIGRRSLGKSKFQKLAAAGKKRRNGK